MPGPAVPWTDGPRGPRDRLHGARRCDVAVVGAGLTGLSTALELAALDPARTITVLEADRVGAGASGRGTGLLGPRIGPALAAARRRHGDDLARAAHLWSVAAVRHVLDLVERHRIDCGLTPGSQLIVAATRQEAREQRRTAEAAGELGLDVTPVEPDALPPLARGCAGGLRFGPAATLDPAALTAGLARLAEQRGVTVLEGSPVRRVRRGRPLTVECDGGAVTADHVVLAVNGYGGPLSPPGVVGVRVQAAVTARLPRDVLDALATLRTEPLVGHFELAPHYRLTPDGRLVVGGGAIRRGPHGSAALAPHRLGAAVRALAPELAGVAVEASWSGPIGVTRDALPVVGWHPAEPRLLHAGGCNGHGLAVCVANGAHLARLIVRGRRDGPRSALPWMRARAPWIPRSRLVDRVLDGYLAHLTARSHPALSRPARARGGVAAPAGAGGVPTLPAGRHGRVAAPPGTADPGTHRPSDRPARSSHDGKAES